MQKETKPLQVKRPRKEPFVPKDKDGNPLYLGSGKDGAIVEGDEEVPVLFYDRFEVTVERVEGAKPKPIITKTITVGKLVRAKCPMTPESVEQLNLSQHHVNKCDDGQFHVQWFFPHATVKAGDVFKANDKYRELGKLYDDEDETEKPRYATDGVGNYFIQGLIIHLDKKQAVDNEGNISWFNPKNSK